MAESKRIEWIDISKLIAIFTMVWCHTMVPKTVDSVVHAFHMPIFFILSGYCLNAAKHRDLLRFVRSRAKTLLVPYAFWGIALFAVWDLFYLCFNRSKLVTIRDFLYAFLYNNAEYSPFCVVQWFLTCLFFALIISLIVLKLCRENAIAVFVSIIVLFFVGWRLPFVLPFRLPLALDVAVSAAGFVLCGWFVANVLSKVTPEAVKRVVLHPLLIPVEFAVGIGLAYYNGYVNMRLISYANPILFYASAIILSLAIAHLSYAICDRITHREQKLYKGMLFLGKNTLPILMLNQLLIQPTRLILAHVSAYTSLGVTQQYLLWFVFSVVLLLVMMPIIKLLNRYLPFSVGR